MTACAVNDKVVLAYRGGGRVAKRQKLAPGTLWWTHLPVFVPGDSLDQTIQEAESLVIKLRKMKADGLKIRPFNVTDEMGKMRVLVTNNPTVAKKWKMDDAAASAASRAR
jgi:hypothetical protein